MARRLHEVRRCASRKLQTYLSRWKHRKIRQVLPDQWFSVSRNRRMQSAKRMRQVCHRPIGWKHEIQMSDDDAENRLASRRRNCLFMQNASPCATAFVQIQPDFSASAIYRQQREEILRRQEKLDAILKKKNLVRPESPETRRRKLKRNYSVSTRHSNSKLKEVSSTTIPVKQLCCFLWTMHADLWSSESGLSVQKPVFGAGMLSFLLFVCL